MEPPQGPKVQFETSRSSNPPGPWNSWDEYLQNKPEKLTPNQIIGVVAQNQHKINRSIARILELFDWYSSSRIVSIIARFDHCVGSEANGGESQRWRRALMDFAFRNITFNMKQLVEVLRCDLQVTIQEGLMETQMELLKTIAGFIDHFHLEMIPLSPPQMHALLDHLRTRWAGGQALLDAIRCGNTSTRPESFLDKGPSHLLQSFFDSLPDHQVDIKRGSTALTQIEVEVNSTAAALRACMTNVCADPTLMLNLKPSVQAVTTIDLTQDEAVIKFPLERGNIVPAQRDNKDAINAIPDNTSSICNYSFMSVAPSLAGSTVPTTVASPSGQPHSSLKIDKSIRWVKNLSFGGEHCSCPGFNRC